MTKMKKTLLGMAKTLFGSVVTLGLQLMLVRGPDLATVLTVLAGALAAATLLLFAKRMK